MTSCYRKENGANLDREIRLMDRYRRGGKLLCVAVAMAAALPISAANATLEQTLAKMDQVATRFKGISANVQYMQHMDAIHEDDLQSGTILVKRANRKDLHVKISIEKPDAKVAVTDGNKVNVYYPRSGEVQVLTLGHRRSLVDMILTLGFGGGSKEMQDAYQVSLEAPTPWPEKAPRGWS